MHTKVVFQAATISTHQPPLPARHCWFLMAGLLLCNTLLAATAAAAPLYICQYKGQAIYTSYPQKLPKGRCQPSAMQAVNNSDAPKPAIDNADDPIRQFWYNLEFGHIDAATKIMPPPPPASTASKPSAGTNSNMRAPAPAKLSPRQLVERDIAHEKRALLNTQQQLAQARQTRNMGRIDELTRSVNDYLHSIRAMEEELKRF